EAGAKRGDLLVTLRELVLVLVVEFAEKILEGRSGRELRQRQGVRLVLQADSRGGRDIDDGGQQPFRQHLETRRHVLRGRRRNGGKREPGGRRECDGEGADGICLHFRNLR